MISLNKRFCTTFNAKKSPAYILTNITQLQYFNWLTNAEIAAWKHNLLEDEVTKQ